MSSNKTITIDPEMFKIKVDSNQRKTRKKKSDDPNNASGASNKIKFKQPAPNKSVKYNKLLKYIREKQNKNYENLFNKKNGQGAETDEVDILPLSPKSEFEESLRFLKEIREKTTPTTTPFVSPLQQLPPLAVLPSFKENGVFQGRLTPSASHNNHTIKNYGNAPPNVGLNLPSNIPQLVDANVQLEPGGIPFRIEPTPKFGVLKNGSLPTYRQYMKSVGNTQPYPNTNIVTYPNTNIVPYPNTNTNIHPNEFGNTAPPVSLTFPAGLNPLYNQTEGGEDSKESEIQYRANMVKVASREKHGGGEPHIKLFYPKRKKTIKRTFRVGRSKHYSKIGVLINNKTIRDECSTKKHLLKQATLGDIKRFLVKKGLIKVGSTAPNDVLRKMYESVNMICGDVQNHNSDILLHNYFNDVKG
jgi:hypothetical protein